MSTYTIDDARRLVSARLEQRRQQMNDAIAEGRLDRATADHRLAEAMRVADEMLAQHATGRTARIH